MNVGPRLYSVPQPVHRDAPGAVASAPQKPKKLNVLALVAMIVAVVGFLFACVPGALVLGWILLPVAFVLSIVSLFLKGDKKWFGIVGLVVSIVGTVVGILVFFAVVATSFDEALGSGDTVVSQPSDEVEGAPAEEAEDPVADAVQGSRETPYPLASTINSDEWTVVVNSHAADGNATVAAANHINDAAPARSHYEIVIAAHRLVEVVKTTAVRVRKGIAGQNERPKF